MPPDMDLSSALGKGSISQPLKITADKANIAGTFSGIESVLCKSFPNLFIIGQCGGEKQRITPTLVTHFWKYYDGRFLRCPLFLATIFSMHMRHLVMAKGADMKGSDPFTLKQIGDIMNASSLEKDLEQAANDPVIAKRVDDLLCNLMTQMGSAAPFTQFADNKNRMRMKASRIHHGGHAHFATYAPIPWENATFLRASLLTMSPAEKSTIAPNLKPLNDPTCPIGGPDFTTHNFPPQLNEKRTRMSLTSDRAGLAALFFQHSMNLISPTLVQCPMDNAIKKTSHWAVRPRGAFGYISCINENVESRPSDGVLHAHVLYRGPKQGARMLRLSATCQSLREKMALFLDSVSKQHISDTAHGLITAQQTIPLEARLQIMQVFSAHCLCDISC